MLNAIASILLMVLLTFSQRVLISSQAKGLKKTEPKKETPFPVSCIENSTSVSVIASVTTVKPEKPHQLELDDTTFKQFSMKILMQSITEVFYSSFHEQFMEIG